MGMITPGLSRGGGYTPTQAGQCPRCNGSLALSPFMPPRCTTPGCPGPGGFTPAPPGVKNIDLTTPPRKEHNRIRPLRPKK